MWKLMCGFSLRSNILAYLAFFALGSAVLCGCATTSSSLVGSEPSSVVEAEEKYDLSKCVPNGQQGSIPLECLPLSPKVALVIGLNDYVDRHNYVGEAWSDLPVAQRDALAMSEMLSSQGFQLIGGGPQSNLTNVELRAKLMALAAAAKDRQAIVLIYISGHGFSNSGRSYIAPVDAPKPILGVKLQENRYLGLADIESILSDAHPALTIIFFDSCRNHLRSTAEIEQDKEALGNRSIFALAAEPGKSVPIWHESRLSPYTEAMIDTLSAPDRQKTIYSSLTDVGQRVSAWSDENQNPVFKVGDKTLNRLNTSMIFGMNSMALVSKRSLVTEDELFKFVSETFDYEEACRGWPDSEPTSEAVLLLRAMDRSEIEKRCHELRANMMRFESSLTGETKLSVQSRIVDGPGILLKQFASDGNAHANFQVFLYYYDGIEKIVNREQWDGQYLSSDERNALEYLFSAADKGDPSAQFLAGQISMPYPGKDTYGFVIPGDAQAVFDRGARYLETALDSGNADAGYVLAVNARRNFTDLDTNQEKFREYAEKALSSKPLLFPDYKWQELRYELAEDYIFDKKGGKDTGKGIEILKTVFNSTSDSVLYDESLRGWAATLIFVMLRSEPGLTTEARNTEVRYYALEAAKLDVGFAQKFVSKAFKYGQWGFGVDKGASDMWAKKAQSKSYRAPYSITY